MNPMMLVFLLMAINLPLARTGFGDPGQARAILRKTIGDPCTVCAHSKAPPTAQCYTSTKTCPNGQWQLHLCKGQKMDALGEFSLSIVGQAPKIYPPTQGKPPLSVLAPLFLPLFMLNAIRRLSPALTGTKHTGMQL